MEPLKIPLEELTRVQGGICTICGLPADVQGMFIPPYSENWGATPGKSRFFIYGLCERCRVRPNSLKAVEKIIHFHKGDF